MSIGWYLDSGAIKFGRSSFSQGAPNLVSVQAQWHQTCERQGASRRLNAVPLQAASAWPLTVAAGDGGMSTASGRGDVRLVASWWERSGGQSQHAFAADSAGFETAAYCASYKGDS